MIRRDACDRSALPNDGSAPRPARRGVGSEDLRALQRVGLDEALARSGDGAFAVNADGIVVLWNGAAEKVLGYSPREALGRPCCDLFTGVDESGNRLCYRGCHVMALVGMGEAVQTFDMKTRAKSGRLLWINVSTLVIQRDAPGGQLTVHLFRDVTATKELLALVHERFAAPGAPSSNGAASTLTRREIEILQVVATGASTRAIAEKLHVSPATVRNHVQNILTKLGVHNRLEAVAWATRHRLV